MEEIRALATAAGGFLYASAAVPGEDLGQPFYLCIATLLGFSLAALERQKP